MGGGQSQPHASIPYFWSDWYDSRLQFVGSPDADDEPTLLGEPEAGRFAALYRVGDQVIGAFAIDQPRFIVKQRLAIHRGLGWHEALTRARDLLS